MGVQLMEIALGLGKRVFYTMMWCFRLVCSHTSVFGFLCFMVFLYRMFPLIFSLMVSASPVVVCTAVLLGILLSYGHPMVPEMEMGGERIGEGVLMKARVWEGGVVGENGRRDELESLAGNLDFVVDERLERIQLIDGGIGEMSRDLGEFRGEVKVKLDNGNGGVMENHFAAIAEVVDDAAWVIEERLEGERMSDGGIGGVSRDLGELKVKLDNGNGEVVENHFVPIAEVVDDASGVIEERLEADRMSNGSLRGVSRDLGEFRGEVKAKLKDARVGNGEVVENHFVSVVDDVAQLLEERLERMSDGISWDLGELRDKVKAKSDDERVGVGEVVEEDEKCSSDDETDSFDSEEVNVDSLDSPPQSPLAGAAEREVNEKEKDEEGVSGSDSGSDHDKSLSPDALVEDIMPILDELHPLLDEEVLQAIHLSHDSSNAASERSLTSGTDTTLMSGDEIEDHIDSDVVNAENDDGEEEDGHGDEEELLKSTITWTEEDQKNLMELRSSEIERNQRLENLIMMRNARSVDLDKKDENHDDIDDNEDEEDGQEDKEEETKSAITWTEEDQKNLMDLGWSEIERNRRLESLIMRRRAKKNMAGLESFDLPFNIAPISTRRRNPFDLPHNSDDGSELPPIPGSAPSVLLPIRNPFNIPYDSGEEKPDLLGDEFQKEFTTSSLRESFFQRQGTFHVRPSSFAREDVKMRPYFVPEHTFSEEPSSSQPQHQLSELSDSKVSSVAYSESTNSLEDLEERKFAEEDEAGEIDEFSEAREVAEEGLSRNLAPIFQQEKVIEGYRHLEPVVNIPESVLEEIRHESLSLEGDDSSESDESEVSEIQFQSHDADDHYPQEGISRHVEVQATVNHLDSEAAELRDSRNSSSPSLSKLS